VLVVRKQGEPLHHEPALTAGRVIPNPAIAFAYSISPRERARVRALPDNRTAEPELVSPFTVAEFGRAVSRDVRIMVSVQRPR
jgi:hypothetical protein